MKNTFKGNHIMNLNFFMNELNSQIYIEILQKTIGQFDQTLITIDKAIKNSICTVVVFDNTKPIGMGRIVGDGALYFYFQDICIIPEYQNLGIGKKIIKHLIGYVKRNYDMTHIKYISLISAKEKETFYRKLGFEELPNEITGAGMRLYF